MSLDLSIITSMLISWLAGVAVGIYIVLSYYRIKYRRK